MNSGPALHVGMTASDVKKLQRLLVALKELNFDQIDGTFGSTTEPAVKSFQQSNGLTADGIVGSQTWSKLPADPQTPVLSQRDTGAVVSALQKVLKSYSAESRSRPRDHRWAVRSTHRASSAGLSIRPRGDCRWDFWRRDVVGPRRCGRSNSGLARRTYNGVSIALAGCLVE
jgi:hypothetical protein